MITIRKADPVSLRKIWEKNVRKNPGDPNWLRWREEYLSYNQNGMANTYLVLDGDDPVGEGTLLFSGHCSAIHENAVLCDGKTVLNVNALRIEKAYEGMGYISALVKQMEADAKALGYRALTIGVEAANARNLAIYLHWGYHTLVHTEWDDGELILYYRKEL